MADHMRAELVVDALQMALARRRPGPGLICHSDQGSQFVSLAFGQAARDAGIAVSMGSRGCAYDNVVAESFFATLKKELVRRRSWPERRELLGEDFDYIETFYNARCRHSTLGYARPSNSRPALSAQTVLETPLRGSPSPDHMQPSHLTPSVRRAGALQGA
jgi:putative transposase